MKHFIRALACAGLLHVPLAGADPLPATPADVAAAPDATAAQTETPAPVAEPAPGASAATAADPSPPVGPVGPPAQVEQPRAWGHSIGDVLSQRVLLQVQGRTVDLPRLPDPGRIGVWLERRPAHIETDADGRRWLRLDYQLINAPQALTAVSLPALELRTAAGILQVPAWPVSAAPLTPRSAFAEGALHTLQPDRAAPAIDTAPLRRQLALWSTLCGALLLAWAGWFAWRNWRSARSLPFARARRALRALGDDAPEAWQVLHRAFDRCAGASLQAASLHRLFERAPQFAPLRADIERFYAASAARFFGGHAAMPSSAAAMSPRALAQALARIERRHES
jgi:mxaA protein